MRNEVKVGDVWRSGGVNHTILKVLENEVVSCWRANKLYADVSPISFFHDFTLIERDGKPVRHFEEGAFYPVHIINASNPEAILRYIRGAFWPNPYFNTHNEYVGVRESVLSYIGPKLEIEWPEVEG